MKFAHTESKLIEAQVRIGFGEVALVRECWNKPIDVIGLSRDHHLQLSMMPSSNNAMACFPDHWGPHRFERLGEVFLLPAQQHLHARSDCLHQQSITCRFEPDSIAEWFDVRMEWTDKRLQGSLDIASGTIRRLLFQIGEELRSPGFASEALVELIAAQISIELSRYFLGIEGNRATGGLAPWRLRLIDDYLVHSAAKATLTELARLCNLSVRHLTRAFRISRGRSLGEYIAEYRVDQARHMLANGLSVKEAAFATGFAAPTNFAAAFRRATGETPRQYRQRARRSAIDRHASRGKVH